jgi:hypothetical protein
MGSNRVCSSLALKYLTWVKGLRATNTLAYYGTELITTVKSFEVFTLGPIL